MRDIEQIIREVNGTMAIEGMPLTDEDKNRLRNILCGQTSIDGVIGQLKKKYSTKVNRIGERA
jgi:hypothetical protein